MADKFGRVINYCSIALTRHTLELETSLLFCWHIDELVEVASVIVNSRLPLSQEKKKAHLKLLGRWESIHV
jgi:hypothetical protein